MISIFSAYRRAGGKILVPLPRRKMASQKIYLLLKMLVDFPSKVSLYSCKALKLYPIFSTVPFGKHKHGDFHTFALEVWWLFHESQDIVLFEKQSDLEDQEISTDDKDVDFESRPTTSDAFSPFPDGGWRAWSVLLSVYVYFCFPMISIYRIIYFVDGSPNFAGFPPPFVQFYDVTMSKIHKRIWGVQRLVVATLYGWSSLSSWITDFTFEPIWQPALPRRSGIWTNSIYMIEPLMRDICGFFHRILPHSELINY